MKASYRSLRPLSREVTLMNDTAKIRVLLAEDHTVMRAGLRLIVGGEDDLIVVGEAKDGLEAIDKAKELQPDVIVMDITMPSLGGLEATRQIKRDLPQTRVLFLTIHDNEEYFFQAIQAGGDGYVTKAAPEWEVLAAIRSVHNGDCYLNPGVAKMLVGDYLERVRRGEKRDPPRSPDGPRARGAAPGGRRPLQPGDGQDPEHQRAHRAQPPRPPHGETRRSRPPGTAQVRHPPRHHHSRHVATHAAPNRRYPQRRCPGHLAPETTSA